MFNSNPAQAQHKLTSASPENLIQSQSNLGPLSQSLSASPENLTQSQPNLTQSDPITLYQP